MRRLRQVGGYAALALGVVALVAVAFVYVQGRRTPTGTPAYVAMGSSYAAGAGLGRLEPGSPLLCARSVGGYPQRLAKTVGLPLVDMACGGAVTAHLLRGGQFFQGPQVRVVDRRTRLVTITVGGNDVGLVGDLSLLVLRRRDGIAGWLARRFWSGPRPFARRDFDGVRRDLLAVIRTVRARAPNSRVVVATYPAVLPAAGTCDRLQLNSAEAELMRPVERALAAATAAAAVQGGALLVDMHALGAGHDACSADPWTRGWAALSAAPFHPTASGAQATADAIAGALRLPAGVAAIGEHDAAGQEAGGVRREEQHH